MTRTRRDLDGSPFDTPICWMSEPQPGADYYILIGALIPRLQTYARDGLSVEIPATRGRWGKMCFQVDCLDQTAAYLCNAVRLDLPVVQYHFITQSAVDMAC